MPRTPPPPSAVQRWVAGSWPIIGIDPGGRYTGIVARDREAVVSRQVVDRGTGVNQLPWGDYRDAVYTECLAAQRVAPDAWFALEDVNEPTPQMGTIAVRGLLDTARMIGALESLLAPVLVVPPAGHGSAHLLSYPEALRGPREDRGTGILRHARSAWDVALTARNLQRLTHGRRV